ncbi:MAG: hypothetical protein EZS28_055112, partial [Streblomastix strix]
GNQKQLSEEEKYREQLLTSRQALLVTSCVRALQRHSFAHKIELRKDHKRNRIDTQNRKANKESSKSGSTFSSLVPIAVFGRMCLMLCPIRQVPEIQLRIKKKQSQEEFIPGSVSDKPFSSKTLSGPLFRDLKKRICSECSLGESVVQDDNTLEMLVDDKLINLDLSIVAVYEKIWIPHLRDGNRQHLRRNGDNERERNRRDEQ